MQWATRQVLWVADDGSLAVWLHVMASGPAPLPRMYHSADAFNGAQLLTEQLGLVESMGSCAWDARASAAHPAFIVTDQSEAIACKPFLEGTVRMPCKLASALSPNIQAHINFMFLSTTAWAFISQVVPMSGPQAQLYASEPWLCRALLGGRSMVVLGGSYHWRSQTSVPFHVLDVGALTWQSVTPPAFRHFPDSRALEPWMASPGNRMLHLTAVRAQAPSTCAPAEYACTQTRIASSSE